MPQSFLCVRRYARPRFVTIAESCQGRGRDWTMAIERRFTGITPFVTKTVQWFTLRNTTQQNKHLRELRRMHVRQHVASLFPPRGRQPPVSALPKCLFIIWVPPSTEYVKFSWVNNRQDTTKTPSRRKEARQPLKSKHVRCNTYVQPA